MKSLLTFLFMVLFMLVPPLLKKVFKTPENKKKTAPKTHPHPDFAPDLKTEYHMEDSDSFLQESKAKIPKQPEYFTYETLDADAGSFIKNPETEKQNSSQMSENEQKDVTDLTFEKEELYKGVIYSEILKRKYN